MHRAMFMLKKHIFATHKYSSYSEIAEMFDITFTDIILSKRIGRMLTRSKVQLNECDEEFFKELFTNHRPSISTFICCTDLHDDHPDQFKYVLRDFCKSSFIPIMFETTGEIDLRKYAQSCFTSYFHFMYLFKLDFNIFFNDITFEVDLLKWFVRKIIQIVVHGYWIGEYCAILSNASKQFIEKRFPKEWIDGCCMMIDEVTAKNFREKCMDGCFGPNMVMDVINNVFIESLLNGTDPAEYLGEFFRNNLDILHAGSREKIFLDFIPEDILEKAEEICGKPILGLISV